MNKIEEWDFNYLEYMWVNVLGNDENNFWKATPKELFEGIDNMKMVAQLTPKEAIVLKFKFDKEKLFKDLQEHLLNALDEFRNNCNINDYVKY